MPVPSRPLYCSEDMIRSELPIDLPSGSFTSDEVTGRVGMWSGFIDDYLAGQYTVPFAAYPQTPSSVTIACIYLVVHYSYILAGVPTEKEDPRQSLWGRAIDLLDKIRDRTLILTDNDNDPNTNPARSTLPLMIGPSTTPGSLMSQQFLLGPTFGQRGQVYGGLPYNGYGGYTVYAGDDVPEGK